MPTTQEFYNMIMAEKQSFSSLDEITTIHDSQDLLAQIQTEDTVDDFSLIAWIFAFGAFIVWKLFGFHLIEVDNKLAREKTPTTPWCESNAKKFQLGHLLVLNDEADQYEYLENDPASQIIKFCAVDEQSRAIKYKVAKDNGSGMPTPLDVESELPQFLEYLERTRAAGPKVIALSSPPDLLWLQYDIYYDPLVDIPTFKTACEAAINGYLTNNNKAFRGIISTPNITDELQKVPGMKYPVLVSAKRKYEDYEYESFAIEYIAFAGYAVIDVDNHPLSATLNYIPYQANEF
jgi:hypothetical protein